MACQKRYVYELKKNKALKGNTIKIIFNSKWSKTALLSIFQSYGVFRLLKWRLPDPEDRSYIILRNVPKYEYIPDDKI